MIKEKNIVVYLLLSIFTCGIGALVWFCSLTNDAAMVADEPDFNGVKALLLTIVTCGIYAIYWNYKMGKMIYMAGSKRNVSVSDNSIAYLILAIFGFGIVSYCFMQSDLNKFANS